MKINPRVVLIAGISSAIIAAFLTVYYIQSVKKSLFKNLEPVKTVVAARDMKEGEVIEESDLKIGYVPQKYLHPMNLKPDEIPLVVGQRLRNPLHKGFPVTWNDLGTGKGSGALSETLIENERAVSIPVNAVSAVSGLVRPGDHVDILWIYSGPFPDGRGGTFVRTILQNVTVLAVGGSTSPESAGTYSTVTLALSPEEVELITFANYKGELVLSLRNRKDISVANRDESVNLETLFGEKVKKIQDTRTLRVIKGR